MVNSGSRAAPVLSFDPRRPVGFSIASFNFLIGFTGLTAPGAVKLKRKKH